MRLFQLHGDVSIVNIAADDTLDGELRGDFRACSRRVLLFGEVRTEAETTGFSIVQTLYNNKKRRGQPI